MSDPWEQLGKWTADLWQLGNAIAAGKTPVNLPEKELRFLRAGITFARLQWQKRDPYAMAEAMFLIGKLVGQDDLLVAAEKRQRAARIGGKANAPTIEVMRQQLADWDAQIEAKMRENEAVGMGKTAAMERLKIPSTYYRYKQKLRELEQS